MCVCVCVCMCVCVCVCVSVSLSVLKTVCAFSKTSLCIFKNPLPQEGSSLSLSLSSSL